MAQDELFQTEAKTLQELRADAADCKACDLWKTGTQTVFGEGEPTAEIVFVGEQPGDKEDLEGAQFVIKNPNATTTCGCGSSFSP